MTNMSNQLLWLTHFIEILLVIEFTGASLVDQYPMTLVHIVGFKIIKN